MNIDPLTISRGSLSLPARMAVEQLSAKIACEVTTESETEIENIVTTESTVTHTKQHVSPSFLLKHMKKAARQNTANRMKISEIELSQ
jgi:hypothetical protein